MATRETIDTRMISTGGRTTGFDYLRSSLSIAVIVFHGVITSYGAAAEAEVWTGWWHPFLAVVLPAFFALSGFLVSTSLVRSKTIFEFITLRMVRMMPALFGEILLSAMLLGPLLTVLPLSGYFSSHQFYVYWLNVVGEIHYELPGLFLSNPDPGRVNLQLWTIPLELKCYFAVICIYFLGASRHRVRMLWILAASMVLLPLEDMLLGHDMAPLDTVPSKVLIESFVAGVTVFFYRDRIPLNFPLFLLSAVLSFLCLGHPATTYVACLPVAYLTMYLGLSNAPRTVLARIGDYSYGLYIYGYAVQQTYAWLFPTHRVWWMNVAVSLPAALVCAIISWHLIEKPALDNRKRAVAAVDKVAALIGKGLKRLLPADETGRRRILRRRSA